MAVSFPVATHPAKPFPFPDPWAGHTAPEVFRAACQDQYTKAGEILQFSLPRANGKDVEESGRDMTAKISDIVPQKNGFVATVLDAYTQDRALVLRPDDVWLAILCQFNFFVNARAEILRANFVAHTGTQELTITVVPADRYSVDFGHIARQMAGLVEKNVVDPTLRAWATPSFTTTTTNDTTVSAVLLLATLKAYFDYTIILIGCGIPRVTIEGERSDWADILARLERLKEYGLETTAWYHLLHPVISRFVGAFDDPTSGENVDFWQCVAHYIPGGSGSPGCYTGWISAFTVFDKEGRWMGNELKGTPDAVPDPALTTALFWAKHLARPPGSESPNEAVLVLDNTPYHPLYRNAIPPGYAEVDVLLIDNGERFACAMAAGSVGTHVGSSGDCVLSPGGRDDTVRPVVGWWLFVKDEDGKRMKRRAKEAGMRTDRKTHRKRMRKAVGES